MKLVVGLGNPGARYTQTRHNVGYRVLDTWCEEHRVPAVPPGAVSSELRGCRLCKTGPAMNVCGPDVKRRLDEQAIPPADMFVVCDDFHLPVGHLRVRRAGSAGGHHGLASIIEALGTTAFPRLRIGIGAVPAGRDGAAFVLGAFAAHERPVMDAACVTAAQAIDVWLAQGITATMNQFNRNVET